MHKISLIACVSLLAAASSSLALSGGPFDNDSQLPGGGTGTYQGAISGKNLIGIFAFGWSSNSGSTGRYAVFDRGVAVFGDMAAFVDIRRRDVSGVFAADQTTGNTGAQGGFKADVTHSYPVFMFEGKGQINTPSSVRNSNTVTDTLTTNVDTGKIVDANGQTVQVTQVITDTNTSNLTTNDFVKIHVRGVRTSTVASTFSVAPLVGEISGGGGAVPAP